MHKYIWAFMLYVCGMIAVGATFVSLFVYVDSAPQSCSAPMVPFNVASSIYAGTIVLWALLLGLLMRRSMLLERKERAFIEGARSQTF